MRIGRSVLIYLVELWFIVAVLLNRGTQSEAIMACGMVLIYVSIMSGLAGFRRVAADLIPRLDEQFLGLRKLLGGAEDPGDLAAHEARKRHQIESESQFAIAVVFRHVEFVTALGFLFWTLATTR